MTKNEKKLLPILAMTSKLVSKIQTTGTENLEGFKKRIIRDMKKIIKKLEKL